MRWNLLRARLSRSLGSGRGRRRRVTVYTVRVAESGSAQRPVLFLIPRAHRGCACMSVIIEPMEIAGAQAQGGYARAAARPSAADMPDERTFPARLSGAARNFRLKAERYCLRNLRVQPGIEPSRPRGGKVGKMPGFRLFIGSCGRPTPPVRWMVLAARVSAAVRPSRVEIYKF